MNVLFKRGGRIIDMLSADMESARQQGPPIAEKCPECDSRLCREAMIEHLRSMHGYTVEAATYSTGNTFRYAYSQWHEQAFGFPPTLNP